MLKHMIKAQVLDAIVGGVDMLIGISEFGLNHERGWVAGFGCRGVIGTSITTLGFHKWNFAIL